MIKKVEKMNFVYERIFGILQWNF